MAPRSSHLPSYSTYLVLVLLLMTGQQQSHAFGQAAAFAKRALKLGVASAAVVTASLLATPSSAFADDSQQVYFGVGCFWHVQREFVETEKKVLGRTDKDVSARAGYAGGLQVGKDDNDPTNNGGKGIVCYHNLLGKGDYGQLGYGEVVSMDVPAASVGAFADEYFSLFGKDLERPDKGDRGPEYRSLLGLPGGMKSPLFPAVEVAAKKRGIALKEGKGNDPDTLGTKSVFVMDTQSFPFRQAEVYHQFHDGFMPGEQYGDNYHNIRKLALEDKRIGYTGCPEIGARSLL